MRVLRSLGGAVAPEFSSDVEVGVGLWVAVALFDPCLFACECGCEVCCGWLNVRRKERKNRSNGPGWFVSAAIIPAPTNKIEIVTSVACNFCFTCSN